MKTKNKDKETKVTEKKGVFQLITILVVLFVISVVVRLLIFNQQTLAVGDQIWKLTYTISTLKTPEAIALRIFPPFDTPNIRTIESSVSHPGFKIRNNSENSKSRRSIYAIADDTEKKIITAEFFIHASETPFTLPSTNKIGLNPQSRESYLLDSEILQLNSYMVREAVKGLLSGKETQEQLVEKIYRKSKALSISNKQDQINVPLTLTNKYATILDKSLVMVALCRSVGIPARLVSGIILKDQFEQQLHHWVELYFNGQWSAYDVHYGYKNTVPINYLPLRRNNHAIIHVLQGSTDEVNVELEQEYNHPHIRQASKSNIVNVFDLKRLPLDTRAELALLLLLPMGALITALFRHLVGVHSYGVFTPTLLALAIVYNDMFTTGIVLFIVISLAVGGRSFFPSSITMIPRLSIIFTLVSFMLALSVSVMDHFELNQAGKVILLPVIILTSLVDRFYRTVEDYSIEIALRRLFWTILITLFCLPVIQFEALGYLILAFPEIHLLTLAIFLLISVYKGDQLIDLPIIKLLDEPERKHNKRSSDRED